MRIHGKVINFHIINWIDNNHFPKPLIASNRDPLFNFKEVKNGCITVRVVLENKLLTMVLHVVKNSNWKVFPVDRLNKEPLIKGWQDKASNNLIIINISYNTS